MTRFAWLLSLILLTSCGAPETAIRLRLVYDDAWALTELTVSTPARQSRVRAEHEVYLLPEASSLGRPMMLRLVGQRGSVPFASGRVTVTPLQDQVVTAEVRLSRLPCGAWCTEGSTVCTGDSVEVCVVDSVGCSAWTQVEVCAEPTTCSLGQCRAACIDECALGDRECAGPSGVRECRSDGDSDACNDWVFVTACAEGETCSRGLCGDECVSECAMGAVRCSLGGVSRCGDLDDDGCLEWGPSLPCEAGESCEGGACAPVESCEDECTMSECAGTVYRQCGNFDLDGCREWSAGTDCAATTGCVAGRCTAGGCETAPRVCDMPSEAECVGPDTLRTYDPIGTCRDGDCQYTSRDVACPSCPACDACAGVVCNTPPGSCYEAMGTCSGGTCSYTPRTGGTCDDGNACTMGDTCASGSCQGTPRTCTTPPGPCYLSTGSCNGATGNCEYGFRDGVSCDDGNPSTLGDTCMSGVCMGRIPMPDAGVDAGARDAGVSDAFDPCALCSPNATCTAGICTCNPGYVGDGRTCMPTTMGLSAVEAYIKASNTGANDEFGEVLALSEDGRTLAVGARFEDGGGAGVNPPSSEGASASGAVYVYTRSGPSFVLQAYIKAVSPGATDQFGAAVALSGDGNVLAVGAPNEDGSGLLVNPTPNDAASEAGAVYTYRRTGTSWTPEAYIKASNTSTDDRFGTSVALSANGTVLAVGAIFEDGSGTGVAPPLSGTRTNSGAVYVYRYTEASWTYETYIKASNASEGDRFGEAVSLSDDGSFLAVGASFEDGSGSGVNPSSNDSLTDSGAAYVYRHDGSSWRFEAILKASNPGALDAFGRSLAVSGNGDVLAVGASSEDGAGNGVDPAVSDGAMDSGAVYVYRRLVTGWTFEAYLKAVNSSAGDGFGVEVDVNRDGTLIGVGALGEDGGGRGVSPEQDESADASGAAFLFRRSGGGWVFAQYLKASNTQAGDFFGQSISLSGVGDMLAVGARGEDGSGVRVNPSSSEGATNSGAVYLYR